LFLITQREFLCWIVGPETRYSKYCLGCP